MDKSDQYLAGGDEPAWDGFRCAHTWANGLDPIMDDRGFAWMVGLSGAAALFLKPWRYGGCGRCSAGRKNRPVAPGGVRVERGVAAGGPNWNRPECAPARSAVEGAALCARLTSSPSWCCCRQLSA